MVPKTDALRTLMSGYRGCTLLCFLAAFCAFTARAQDVVINEIMYHPGSQDPRDEYIELHNRGTTNVNISGWKFSAGFNFTIPANTVIGATDYLVIAGNRARFLANYPGVTNVIGDFVVPVTKSFYSTTLTNFENLLSNTGEAIELQNANGDTIDRVRYADEGDWAQRQRGLDDLGARGWTWFAEHDGLGKSLELMNSGLPNEQGQNWFSSSTGNGTPGRRNSIATNNVAPLIGSVGHFPLVPRSTNAVSVTARIIDESTSGLTVQLFWRVDSITPPAFTSTAMFDDGLHGDGLAGDGLFGGTVPAQANDSVVEFYVRASDSGSRVRTWPGPAIESEDGVGPSGQVVNALYQVDNSTLNDFGGTPSLQPVYKVIMTEAERSEVHNLPCNGPGTQPSSDAQMNATFISLDGVGPELSYLASVKRRGHGSRCANPRNYRVNFASDRPWKGLNGLILNTRYTYVQHFGSTIAIKAGALGGASRAVQVRINNANLAASGSSMYGSYAANEVVNGDWADSHYPLDGGGNVYRVIRDIQPPDLSYRGPNYLAYTNTYFKDSNASENDWADIIAMSRAIGTNTFYSAENARQVINVEQWLTHLAVMNILNNRETGLNTGYNDDYYMYRGVNDPRFTLAFHDLDTVVGEGDSPGNTTTSIFSSTANNGAGAALSRILNDPEFQPLYYTILQRLLDTTFSKPQFDSLIDQTLGSYVSSSVVARMKTWMDARRSSVQSQISGLVPAPTNRPIATISGEPRSPTPFRNASLTVGGSGITSYRYRLNTGAYGAETPVGTAISLANLPQGSTNTVYVIGKTSDGAWQGTNAPTISDTWVVDTNTPAVRLNEVLAANAAALNHAGTFPDAIELFNEGSAMVDLSGLRLTDEKAAPGKFTFPAGTTLNPGAYLVVYANSPDGTPGLHTGFSLDAAGEQVYLFDRASSGDRILDQVKFGNQITDRSIGRVAGAWVLTQPTFGANNNAATVGSPTVLRINEWLAVDTSAEDFVELYNTGTLPVALGGWYLTDNAVGYPTRSAIHPLTFVGPNSFVALTANGENGPGEVEFQLSSDQGEIAFLSPQLDLVDYVTYGPQRSGVSMGRCSDGADAIRSMVLPTAGGANACPAVAPGPVTIPLISATNLWRFDQSGANLGTNWTRTNYNDSAWETGRAMIAREDCACTPTPINTELIFTSPQQTTFYFRTPFVVPQNHSYSAVQFEYAVDDGAVFYLNGQELFRVNLPSGPIGFDTFADFPVQDANSYQGPVTIPLNLLRTGTNIFAVEVHQNTPTSSDVVFGLRVNAVIVTNNPVAAGILINEVLAGNASLDNGAGRTPDYIELYNPSTNAVDLAGLALSDTPADRTRWTFAPGSIIPAQGFFRVQFDVDAPVSSSNTGWGLSANGDSVYLFSSPASGSGLMDAVNFGLQVVDFSISRVPSGTTNWVLSVPTLGGANLAATLGDAAELVINEWMANPAAGEDDWFEIYNPNPQPVAVGGFLLTDNLSTRNKHVITPLSFIGSVTNAWRVFKADGNTANGADHVSFSLGAGGEALGLSYPNQTLISSVTFGAQTEGVSQGRFPDAAPSVVFFPLSPSPEDMNWLPLTNIVISEVLTHTDPPLEDAIELQNVSGSGVNINGWYLSDSKRNLKKYRITNSLGIPANAFAVFYETQFNNTAEAPFNFALSSAHGDDLYLSAAVNGNLTGYRAQVSFGAAENGVSFGRYRKSSGAYDFTALSSRSFGQDAPTSVQQFRTGTGKTNSYPKVGPVIFSEIMYNPPLLGTNDNVRDEFLELRNITAAAVPLYDTAFPTNRWRLRGGVDFDFPPGAAIPANGSLVVVGFDPSDPTLSAGFRSTYGLSTNVLLYGPWVGKLDNGGEAIRLLKPDAPEVPPSDEVGFVPFIVVEEIVYADVAPWSSAADGTGNSLQRLSNTGYGNDPTNWVAAAPNPVPAVGGGSGDADGDGMPDAWEQLYGFQINNPADASQDADGDGMTNLQEYLAGTQPRDASSSLKLTISMAPGGARLSFNAAANVGYTIQYRNSVDTGSWLTLQSVPSAPSARTVTVTNAVPAPPRFYRVTTP